MLAAIILAPLVGAAILGLFGKRMGERLIGLIACATVAVSAILSFYLFFKHHAELEQGQKFYDYLFTWISVGTFRADASLLLDSLSAIYILFITFVAFWIHVFATGYMRGDKGYWRFFAYMNLFMFSMLTLVLADNFVLMFVGWEGVGLCSYLLIGYYFTKDFANDAAKKAFIVNRIGDFGFALGVMLLFLKAGTIFYFDDPARGIHGAFPWAFSQLPDPLGWSAIFAGGMTTIAVLLFVGATGKSAQLPLFVWLPDAMAGPTPVSALIHAATMVTAGVYMIARTNAVFSMAPRALEVVAVVGCVTSLFAATMGLVQNDIKRVLAYSTVSQLGYMFLACGVGAFTAGVFHLMTHAFFKALLFLGSGSVIHSLSGEQDMRKMGALWTKIPTTARTFVVASVAIAGIPPLAGCFSTGAILGHAFERSPILWLLGFITAGMTAFYMFRLVNMTFFGKSRVDHEVEHHIHESPRAMTVPLMILAVLSVIGGWVGWPESLGGSDRFSQFLAPVMAKQAGEGAEAAGAAPRGSA